MMRKRASEWGRWRINIVECLLINSAILRRGFCCFRASHNNLNIEESMTRFKKLLTFAVMTKFSLLNHEKRKSHTINLNLCVNISYRNGTDFQIVKLFVGRRRWKSFISDYYIKWSLADEWTMKRSNFPGEFMHRCFLPLIFRWESWFFICFSREKENKSRKFSHKKKVKSELCLMLMIHLCCAQHERWGRGRRACADWRAN